ncbi:hypothetical protein UA08_07838 [Talaromyces atroroseus]|uniref:Uncharacterized protein n=1 Tax=Talaromyces atroroseus TaxID=1441469 RepID=A0A225A835_TALAT|nr:hypothetical protein UA08_07838 [Talaromyces atroroseus]OKL56871.1 hypothetical protein UA08_07838 [Talaromyces atroroseus]
MDRIGRLHALRRTIDSLPTFFRSGNAVRLTRPFSSSANPLQQEDNSSSNSNSINIIRRTPVASNNAPRTTRPRAVDARSLGAANAGDGTIIRAPRLQLKRSLLRGRGGTGARTGGRVGAAAKSRARGKGAEAGAKRVRRKRSDEEDGDEGRDADVEAAFAEVRNKSKPKAFRYSPVQYDATALKDTWPALPVGKTASAGSVLERLSLSSRRYPNGYVPPQELAKRLFEGERVLFTSEEEKAQAMEEVNKLAQERANKLTQRKGELVEIEDSSFVSINDAERKALVGQLVRGNYENWQQGDARHPILDEVQRQLYNNETYRITGKQSEFMSKFQSLLASSQRVKRA